MATTRVHILAKELGVKSSAIIQKCRDEGLHIKNHMSVISAGLAATIREWFSEGENLTTIETAQKVDLDKVRVKPKKPKLEPQPPEPQVQAEPVSAEHRPAEVPIQQQPEAPIQQTEPQPMPQHQQAMQVLEPAPAREQIQPPPAPEPIKPAGPMLERPSPAKLQGPRVVRVEPPEPLRPVRPRPKPKRDLPIAEPLVSAGLLERGIPAIKGKKVQPKKAKERPEQVAPVDDLELPAKKVKLRQRDLEERQARLEAVEGERLRLRPLRKIQPKAITQPSQAQTQRPKKVTMAEPIVVKDLSAALGVKVSDVIGKLLELGTMATANQVLSKEAAELLALAFDTALVIEKPKSILDQIKDEFDNRPRTHLRRRPVVVAVLGHVDHGKTSLLDRIRSTQVAAQEAGGITQHIGASQVTVGNHLITFLDTPGHEAFTAMRARGAHMTDVVVLVVAVDDGVMPQTAEAIAHAKAAGVPIIVALNKIDLPGWDQNRLFSQLAEHDLVPVQWGGQTEVVKTSAVTGQGLQDLLEHIDYVAELLNLQTDDAIPATGWVIEAKMSQQQGPVASLLIKDGILRKGDILLAGTAYGRVRTIRDSQGRIVKEATGGTPVEVLGLDSIPMAGDRFYCLEDINRAKAAAEEAKALQRQQAMAQRAQVTLDNLFLHIESGKVKELKLIIKADVQGSVEVLRKHLTELSTPEVKVTILHAAVGGVTEGDVLLAEASNAIIIGFSVVADDRAARLAESKGVQIKYYNIIYRVSEDIRKAMAGLLEPEEKENVLGKAQVRVLFKISKVGTVAGCYVVSGTATKSAKIRLIRNNVVIRNDMSVESLKHFKDDARDVRAGLECGIKLAGFDDLKVDDILEFYEIVKVSRSLG